MTFLRRAPFIKRRSAGSGNLYLEPINVSVQDSIGDGAGEWYAYAAFQFNSDGSVISIQQTASNPGSIETLLFNWLISGSASNYDIRITNLSGDPLGPGSLTIDTRYQLDISRLAYIDASWSGSPDTGSQASSTFDVQLIDHSTGNVLKSNTVTLFALAGS
jgi:hypothetical protein